MDREAEIASTKWAVFSLGLILELAIGVAGIAAAWMLLKVNLVEALAQGATAQALGLGAAAGVGGAVLLWLAVKFIRILRKSRSFEMLSIIANASWLQITLLCLVAGLAEELMFRGALQPVLTIWPAAVLFGLLHAYGRLYVFLAILAGAGLGYLYDFTGSLAAAVLAHALYNVTVTVLVKTGLFPTRSTRRRRTDPPAEE